MEDYVKLVGTIGLVETSTSTTINNNTVSTSVSKTFRLNGRQLHFEKNASLAVGDEAAVTGYTNNKGMFQALIVENLSTRVVYGSISTGYMVFLWISLLVSAFFSIFIVGIIPFLVLIWVIWMNMRIRKAEKFHKDNAGEAAKV